MLTKIDLAHYASRAKRTILDATDKEVEEPGREYIRRTVMDAIELMERRVWDDLMESHNGVHTDAERA